MGTKMYTVNELYNIHQYPFTALCNSMGDVRTDYRVTAIDSSHQVHALNFIRLCIQEDQLLGVDTYQVRYTLSGTYRYYFYPQKYESPMQY